MRVDEFQQIIRTITKGCIFEYEWLDSVGIENVLILKLTHPSGKYKMLKMEFENVPTDIIHRKIIERVSEMREGLNET